MTEIWTSILPSKARRYLSKMRAMRGILGGLELRIPDSSIGQGVLSGAHQRSGRGSAGQWLVVKDALFAGWSWVKVSSRGELVAFRVTSQSGLDVQVDGSDLIGHGTSLSGFVHARSDHEALWVWVSKEVEPPRVVVVPVPARLGERKKRTTPVSLAERSYDLYRAKVAVAPTAAPGLSKKVGVTVFGDCVNNEDLMATLCSFGQQSLRPAYVSVGDGFLALLGGEIGDLAERLVMAGDSAPCPTSAEFVVPVRVGDRLASNAIEEYEAASAHFPKAKILYADDDLLERTYGVASPEFKPAFSPILLTSHDYIAGSSCMESDIWETTQLTGEFFGMDMVLGLSDEEIVHIPKVLHHRVRRDTWRRSRGASAGLSESLKKLGSHLGTHRYIAHKYSIVIPVAAKVSLVERCLASIAKMSNGEDYEVLLDVNGANQATLLSFVKDHSDQAHVRVVSSSRKAGEDFNYSRLINGLADEAAGNILVILNDDTEVMTPGWLGVMGEYLSYDRIGLVGPKLVYPRSGRVQYGGGVLGVSGVAAQSYVGISNGVDGVPSNSAMVREVSVITGAAMAVRVEVFCDLGALDDVNLAVSYSDTDLCLKSLAAGYRNVYLPHVVIGHNETATRVRPSGVGERRREKAEFDYARQKWSSDLLEADPYYNPNLTLTYEEGLFNLAEYPRDLGPRTNRITRVKD